MAYHKLWQSKFELSPGKWVFHPTAESKQRGGEIIKIVKKFWTPPDFYYHFLKGGHVRATKAHLKNQYFASLDIDNFFSSINRSRITRALKANIGYNLAREIAKDSVVRIEENGAPKILLPYGFVQSPILASLSLDSSKLGTFLRQLHSAEKVKVSVFVDDIIVSSSNYNYLESSITEIKKCAEISNWVLSNNKEQPINNSIQVFNITLAHNHMEITTERMNDFINAYNNAANDFIQEGIHNYIASVNANQARQLAVY
ncbi:reverse transcriptase domain-containing protein [Advenella kashmirensis]